jgi:outer membrane protein OmpA-like peptidoglycan-associated protein
VFRLYCHLLQNLACSLGIIENLSSIWGLQLVLKTSWPALAAKACACLFAVYVGSTALEAAGQVTAPTPANQDDQVATWWASAQRDHDNRKARLLQLSQNQFVGSPEFYEDLVSRADLPQFPVEIPILRVVFPAKAFFDFDKDQVRPDMAKVLDTVAQAIRAEPHSVSVFVAGHTDGVGDDAYNLLLSIRRAERVAQELNQRGVGNASIWRIGFGKAVPLKPNTTDENRAINRRVEFLVAARPEAIAVWLSKQVEIVCKSAHPEEEKACREALNLGAKFEAVPISPAAKVAPPFSATKDVVDVKAPGAIIIELKRQEYEVIGRPRR